MLIYSETRLVPTDVNMMVIRTTDEPGYLYIHRSLYDQCVILYDIYSSDFSYLIRAITGSTESRPDVDYFIENMPVPINALGPFLLLVNQELTERVDMIGALHVMSGPLHFRNMLKVPVEMRNAIPTFSLSIREEYQLAWDRFFINTMEYSNDMFFPKQVTPMNGTQTTTEPVEGELSNIGDDGVEYADPLEALLFGCSDDIFDLPPEEDEEPAAEETTTATATTPAPAPVSTPEPTPAPAATPEPVADKEEEMSPLAMLASGLL